MKHIKIKIDKYISFGGVFYVETSLPNQQDFSNFSLYKITVFFLESLHDKKV
jgi:hypothetical protein